MKIDAHQHFWQYNPVRDSWIDNSMSVLMRDFLPSELKEEMDNNGIDGCITVQADQSEEETNFLLQLAQSNSFIKGVVGWIDLRAANAEDRLAHFATNEKLKGLRHIVQAEPDEHFMLQNDFKRGISFLSKYRLTYDILIFPKHLGTALELVKQFPEQPFVIDHLAKPQIKEQVFSPWKEQIQALAKAPNVFCKVSGLVTEANWHNWKMEDIRPYLDIAFEAFGTDRLMFGSDWPVCKLAGNYTTTCVLMEEYLKDFSEVDKAKFWGINAAKFYTLN
ncbi:amidohydrolase family protein [Roseivirga echinicomitans]|uniref:Amidohydrolase n=1 Tax=Roseivirga echinicomitans TaxID=296218 RepID=A0A150XYG0_9BACT|nr:amidohydrolase family protein [Roseivirga echinicomitans]KYG83741.1 amidohydrolase [Roseivirga echinicomitans]